MRKFRQKPVVVEAVQFVGENEPEIWDFLGDSYHSSSDFGTSEGNSTSITIKTPEGEKDVDMGDWIIKGVGGDVYPCKPDIFEQTYELVE